MRQTSGNAQTTPTPGTPRLRNARPKLPKAGHFAPSIYNPSGRNQRWKKPPSYKPQPWKPPNAPGPVNPMAPTQVAAPVDYGALISGDWEVQGAEAAMGAGMARNRADFTSQLRQQLIDMGISDVSKLGSLGQYIDNDTIQAAINNKYSATAKNVQHAVQQRDVNNASLAARGMEFSGATTKMQQDVSNQQEANQYGFLRDFLSGGATGLQSMAEAEEGYAQAIAAARANAAGRAGEIGGAYGTADDVPAASAAKAARAAMLGKKAWLKKHPKGRYQNYVRAYKRHTRKGA